MWFSGSATLARAREYNFKNLGPKGRAVWDRAPTAPYGVGPLTFDPYRFAYAAARSSIVGKKLGLRGQIAGLGLASAALSYLTKSTSGDLHLHRNFPMLKDFVGTSLTGTIGAAIAYLEMLDLGYVWQGHWEDCVNSGGLAAHPDFIFAKTSAICLVDAKGTTVSPDSTAKQEWRRQIYTNRAVQMNFGGTATEGRVIAAALSAKNPGVVVTAYGNWLTNGQRTTPARTAVASVQRANFIDAFYLVGLKNFAEKLVGRNSFELLDQGSARLLSIRDEQVYLGPVRMTLTLDDEQWVMQPYCRKEIVDEVIRRFGNVDNDECTPMETTVPESSLQLTHSDNLSTTFIDGPDGVGAIFQPVRFKRFV